MHQLNFEHLNAFCNAWIEKAEQTDIEPLSGVFDKFSTLWVVYNRLYEESGRQLVFANSPIYRQFISNRGPSVYAPPPDKISATKGVVTYCGLANLRRQIFDNPNSTTSIQNIVESIASGMLYLHENNETGEPDHERDSRLVERVNNRCIESLLVLIYQARCNLFHGQKSFTESQRGLLVEMSSILVNVIHCLLESIEVRALCVNLPISNYDLR